LCTRGAKKIDNLYNTHIGIKQWENILLFNIKYQVNGPFFITTLETDILIHPNQMDNNIMDNMKRNLDRRYTGKCYQDYGYISEIYEMNQDVKGGVIRAEDLTSSSVHRVSFTCRIWNPIKNSIIVGKIIGINNMIILAEYGPIKFVIGVNNINKDNIQFRKSAYYPISSKNKNEIINKPISKGTYVMIQVMNKKIVNNKEKIIVIGRLESVVLDENIIQKAIKDSYKSGEMISADNLINDKYFESLNKGQEVEEKEESVSEDSGDGIESSSDDD
jgi:DNA-directed RNA polymerase subunit E'/Rpb7